MTRVRFESFLAVDALLCERLLPLPRSQLYTHPLPGCDNNNAHAIIFKDSLSAQVLPFSLSCFISFYFYFPSMTQRGLFMQHDTVLYYSKSSQKQKESNHTLSFCSVALFSISYGAGQFSLTHKNSFS